MNMKNLRQGNGKTVSELRKSLKRNTIKSRMRGYLKKILVPLDDSKKSIKALDQAIMLASQFESLIVIIYAIPVIRLGDARLAKKLREDQKKLGEKFLEKGKKLCKKYDIKVQSKILHGEPGNSIVRYAHSKKFDIIIMNSSGKGIAKEIFFGSVSNHVLHRSKIPILFTK